MANHINFLDYSLTRNPLSLAIDAQSKVTINTINQYSFCLAEKDVLFRNSLIGSDILLVDGEGIALACQYLTGQRIEKVAGAEMHNHLLECINNEHGNCLYIGSTESTLDKIKNRLTKEYPNITASFYSPPFKAVFDEQDVQRIVNIVNDVKPSVVFIGLTAPKQEKLSNVIKQRIDTNVVCSIGAVFDFYAGTIERPSQFWINLKLEWFIRLLKEPKRMWKRYIYYGFVFVFLIAKEKIKSKGVVPSTVFMQKEAV
ncbi:WecB/TagA/CpsF family glycosyltransferase [Dyadobacter sp. CY323]|uniref:WecB/TagA/CpsF family glycosyltransferase n=1 Tax=Dyadobacter sp. CY323 TaxID=2907302 RepID=UPI001F243C80|nr:WecB/TagA/CpsF family glycosyltransferase [Dyadobacter sp. CY323]MCE6991379.1 WecB/TagA/CpsF family glycosyltransferase [Dyadobacter sp. CY323]